MEYITTKDAAAKWGISTTRITILANEGRIPGATHLGRSWLIPANATKPPELKPNRYKPNKKKVLETNRFSFPLYHLRPDWNHHKEAQLTNQQQQLLVAEEAVLECRFADAYPILKSILEDPDRIDTEVGCLWNAGICCIALNKPEDFSRIFLRFQMILMEDLPHREDLVIIFKSLKTYVETVGSASKTDSYCTDIHDQSMPLLCIQNGYLQLTKETMNPGAADATLLEINLHFLKSTSAIFAVEMLHIYLLGIYNFRRDMVAAEKHAKEVVQIAYETKLYFPIVTYYRYFTPVLSPILAQYPKDFQDHCKELIEQYDTNLTAFFESTTDDSITTMITDKEYPYIFALLMGLSNSDIADKFGSSPATVKRKISKICQKFGVKNKKALKDFLHNYM